MVLVNTVPFYRGGLSPALPSGTRALGKALYIMIQHS